MVTPWFLGTCTVFNSRGNFSPGPANCSQVKGNFGRNFGPGAVLCMDQAGQGPAGKIAFGRGPAPKNYSCLTFASRSGAEKLPCRAPGGQKITLAPGPAGRPPEKLPKKYLKITKKLPSKITWSQGSFGNQGSHLISAPNSMAEPLGSAWNCRSGTNGRIGVASHRPSPLQEEQLIHPQINEAA